ncbi:hypothetical protein SAY86_010441 [Trapa natans]|uniref:Xyloglucan endotransglucosylase/hydrolase n=1 Tax=Trapa natans TaxID=22666 RepID=A0AAN7LT66_TRANT|nr:hypothetical protein SAY86_010441 [Trapa natans]
MVPNRPNISFLSSPSPPLFLVMCCLVLFFSIGTAEGSSDTFGITTLPFFDGFRPLFGDANCAPSMDGRGVSLLLDRFTGAGFISSDMYQHGFYSAKIKLPSNYTAGVVVAFYTSNGDVFEKTHDELDIEFLGNIRGRKWRFQTNVYGNGSTQRGREERYTLWFDPTKNFHRYSILWTPDNVIFYVDEVPIREIKKVAMGGDYPTKPMSLYATIWDASDWATSGGRYKVNYKYAPFVARFTDLSLEGCSVEPTVVKSAAAVEDICFDAVARLRSRTFSGVTSARRTAMRRFRQRYMYYYYCYDSVRYPVPLPECIAFDPIERARYHDTGRLKFGGSHKRQSRHSVDSGPVDYENSYDQADAR